MKVTVNGVLIETQRGDIAEVAADAIVNAANSELWMGGGVAGALKRRGGVSIQAEAVGKGPIPVGSSVETSAGNLNAKWVIHAAVMGPDLQTDATKIREATRSALERATRLGSESVAIPSLGTGVGGFPAEKAAEIMVAEIVRHARKNAAPARITLVLFSELVKEKYDKVLSASTKGT